MSWDKKFSAPKTSEEWLDFVNVYCKKLYGIGPFDMGFTNAELEEFARDFQPPYEFAHHLGSKYGLALTQEWNFGT